MSDDQTPTDEQLVQAARAGERDAFGTLIERYQDRVFNTLLGVLGSREDAADVAQDAFVQAFVKLETFRGTAQFYTWLYRIAMNLALSHRRRRRPVASTDLAKSAVGEEPSDRQPGPQYDLIAREQVAHVRQALQTLGDQHRQILVLREMEGCSYQTIAEILEIQVGTVRSRLFRARMQLKEELQRRLPDQADWSEPSHG